MTMTARKMRALTMFGQEIADHVETCLRSDVKNMTFALVAALAHVGALSINDDENFDQAAKNIRDLYRELIEEFRIELKQQGLIEKKRGRIVLDG